MPRHWNHTKLIGILSTLVVLVVLTTGFSVPTAAAQTVWATPTYSVTPDVNSADDQSAPPVTANEFVPEARNLTDCLSALPKPGCGSEARGGWRQTLVFVAMFAGMVIIVWRIWAGGRASRARNNEENATT